MAIEQAMCHPFVIGELACGNLKNGPEIIAPLSGVPSWTLDRRLDIAPAEVHCAHGR